MSQKVRVRFDTVHMSTSESKAAAAAITKEAGANPNRPIVTINGRRYEEAADDEDKNKDDGNIPIQGN